MSNGDKTVMASSLISILSPVLKVRDGKMLSQIGPLYDGVMTGKKS